MGLRPIKWKLCVLAFCLKTFGDHNFTSTYTSVLGCNPFKASGLKIVYLKRFQILADCQWYSQDGFESRLHLRILSDLPFHFFCTDHHIIFVSFAIYFKIFNQRGQVGFDFFVIFPQLFDQNSKDGFESVLHRRILCELSCQFWWYFDSQTLTSW